MAGSYAAEIGRENPGCIIFLLDQSGSMVDPFAGEPAVAKMDAAADAINKLLMNLILRCTKNVGEGPRNYFDVGVIGYGANAGPGPCLGGALRGRSLVSVEDLAEHHLRVIERSQSGSTVMFPVWFEPVADNGTPMAEALELATKVAAGWANAHRRSYPPVVINITDGEPTGADPTGAARALTMLSTDDGNVLLYNVHLSSLNTPAVLFPEGQAALPDDYAKMLFGMSSVLPVQIRQELAVEGYRVGPAARGFIFNADPVAFIRFLDIGTRLVLEGSAAAR